jgi:hypothetical protein
MLYECRGSARGRLSELKWRIGWCLRGCAAAGRSTCTHRSSMYHSARLVEMHPNETLSGHMHSVIDPAVDLERLRAVACLRTSHPIHGRTWCADVVVVLDVVVGVYVSLASLVVRRFAEVVEDAVVSDRMSQFCGTRHLPIYVGTLFERESDNALAAETWEHTSG